jgi:hypothetical protein
MTIRPREQALPPCTGALPSGFQRPACPMDLLFEACDIVRPEHDGRTSPVSSTSDPHPGHPPKHVKAAAPYSVDRGRSFQFKRSVTGDAALLEPCVPLNSTAATGLLQKQVRVPRHGLQHAPRRRNGSRETQHSMAGQQVVQGETSLHRKEYPSPAQPPATIAVGPTHATANGASGAQTATDPTKFSVSAPAQAKRRHEATARVHRCTFGDCGKLFARTYNLKAHLRVHTRELPYACRAPGCTKRFRWRSSLTSHARLHLQTRTGDDADAGSIVALPFATLHSVNADRTMPQHFSEGGARDSHTVASSRAKDTSPDTMPLSDVEAELLRSNIVPVAGKVGPHLVSPHDIQMLPSIILRPSIRGEGGLSVRSLCH